MITRPKGIPLSKEHKEILSQRMIGKQNALGHKLSDAHRKKISLAVIASNDNIKHHIYLKENSEEIIKLTNSIHRKLHQRVYDYLYEKYSKEGIDNYISWFKEKYNVNF